MRKLNSHPKQPKESISEYLAELRRLTEFCDYGEALEDMLRDRLVCGVNQERKQKRLHSEGPSLTLEKALDIALALESAINQASIIQGHQQPSAIDNTSANIFFNASDKGNDRCFCCDENHLSSACPFIYLFTLFNIGLQNS